MKRPCDWPSPPPIPARRLKLYLAGPMDGCNPEQSEKWRLEAIATLGSHFSILNPMCRDFFKPGVYVREIHEKHIVEGDLGDVETCDVVLAFCWKPSFGTPMEIRHARTQGKYIIVVLPPEMGMAHPFLTYHSDVLFHSLQEAYSYLINFAQER